jgi:hypothetical protein
MHQWMRFLKCNFRILMLFRHNPGTGGTGNVLRYTSIESAQGGLD